MAKFMAWIKAVDVSNFLVTLEIAIAVISLVPLTVVFVFFGLALLAHEGPDPFYPDEIEPILMSSAVLCAAVYALQLVQLAVGILMIRSMSLVKVNFRGAVRMAWVWLASSVATIIVLMYVIFENGSCSVQNCTFLIMYIWVYVLEKSVCVTVVGTFTINGVLFMIRGSPR